ncbi:MAG: hypothetical protein ABIE43_00520 [Patescibacteria group bacterium]
MLETIITIIIVYILLVFILARFFIPHLSFRKKPIPDKIPDSMEKVIRTLKIESKNKEDFLNKAYNYLGGKYRSERFNTFFKFNYLFKSLDEAWEKKGYMPCTQSNNLLRIFLIKSGFFKEREIKIKNVFANFILHQYLKINLNDRWINVDVGEKQRGLKIGEHLKYFG